MLKLVLALKFISLLIITYSSFFLVVFSGMASLGSSDNEMEKKLEILEKRENVFLRGLEAFNEANRKLQRKVERFELKLEELEDALKEA